MNGFIWQTIFLFSFLLSGVYFVILKENVDIYSVAYAGTSFYFLPAILGKGIGISGVYEVYWQTWIFVISFIILLTAASCTSTRYLITIKDHDEVDYFSIVMLLFAYIVFFLLLIEYDFRYFGNAKASIEGGLFSNLYRFLGPIALVTSLYYNHYKSVIIISISLILYTLMFQVRSAFIFAVLSALLLIVRRQDISKLGRVRYGTVGAASGFMIIFFDKVKGSILTGKWDILFNMERNMSQIIWNNNGHIIFQILNTTIEQDYRLSDPVEHLAVNILQILPLTDTLFSLSGGHYGASFKTIFLPGEEAGIGSNIWAEGYSIFGFTGLIIIVILFLVSLNILNGLLRSTNTPLKIFALVTAPYVGFYVHRLASGSILNILMVFFLLVFVPWNLMLILEQKFPTSD